MTQDKTLLPDEIYNIKAFYEPDLVSGIVQRLCDDPSSEIRNPEADIKTLLQALETALWKVERAKEALEFCASDQADRIDFTVFAPKRTKGQYRAMRALKELEE